MSKTTTAAKKKAETKTEPPKAERVMCRIEVAGEYWTGTTSFRLAKGLKVPLPADNAERHAKDGKVTIL